MEKTAIIRGMSCSHCAARVSKALNKIDGVNDKFNLSVGTEVEVSNNFYKGRDYVIPTLALKWTLN